MARLIRAPAGAHDDRLVSRGTPGMDVVRAGVTPHRTLGCGAGLLALGLGVATHGTSPALAEVVGRPSVSTAGKEANGRSFSPDLSGDGRFVAFWSVAGNLVPGDTNDTADVFVRDRRLRVTTRVSVGPRGAQGDDQSGNDAPSMSRDGRLVAFESYASTLVAGDTNRTVDVFVHDRRARATRRVSVATGGAQANGGSIGNALSADGRFVAFYSEATNLVPGDRNGRIDVFVHGLSTGRTELVSVGAGGRQGDGDSFRGGISADGRFVGFWSRAGNLVPGDTNRLHDVFVRDRKAGTTERVSVGPRGRQANGGSAAGAFGGSVGGALSADGRFVAFSSDATNLVAGDTNGKTDVFVHDRETRRTTRVSVGAGGAQGDGESTLGGSAALSADGRLVVFSSEATNLVPGDTNGARDVFVHDRGTGRTRRVSVGPGGTQATGNLGFGDEPAISDDGSLVSFISTAANLWPGDTNENDDVFIAKTR